VQCVKVAKVSERQAMNQEAYILFYEQGSHDQPEATAENVIACQCFVSTFPLVD